MTLTAQFTKMYGKREVIYRDVTVELQWHDSLQSWWVKINGGPTGYESAQVNEILKHKIDSGWCCCAGTEGSWDKCVIPGDQMNKLRDHLNFISGILAVTPTRL